MKSKVFPSRFAMFLTGFFLILSMACYWAGYTNGLRKNLEDFNKEQMATSAFFLSRKKGQTMR
jgi:hypothetical protein